MTVFRLDPCLYEETIERVLAEDLGRGGDITSAAIIPSNQQGSARIISREKGGLAGVQVALAVFRKLETDLEILSSLSDGTQIEEGSLILEVHGSMRALLSAERAALNFLAHMSGIATLTNRFVQAVSATRARIVDTRKTLPGLRILEKYAVRCGGGHNHRMGLDDAILIKDNHIIAAGGIVPAIEACRRMVSHCHKIEVEVDTLEQLKDALKVSPDIVLLDNMSIEELREAVRITDGQVITEASGGITLKRVAEIAATGVDVLSIGALTHSAPSLDLTMELRE